MLMLLALSMPTLLVLSVLIVFSHAGGPLRLYASIMLLDWMQAFFPPGRQPIKTALVGTDRYDQVVDRLRVLGECAVCTQTPLCVQVAVKLQIVPAVQ